jgi:hypothetical protein
MPFASARPLVIGLVFLGGCAAADPPPTFGQFPARVEQPGPGVPIDWSSDASALRFRTRIEAGRQAGANFAGHLSIITWGCGTQCLSYQILDLRTGRLVSDTLLDFSCHEPEFRRDSELIVQLVDTATYGPCSRGVTRYFRWTGERLEEIGAGTT